MQKVKFKMKSNVGPHYDGAKQYVSGDIIHLDEHQAESIMFKLDRIDPPTPEPEPEFTMIIVETDNDLFDVVNELTSERVNEEPLTLDQAQALVGEDVPVQRLTVDPGKIKVIHQGEGQYLVVWDETEKPVVEQTFTRAEAAKIIESIDQGEATVEDLVKEWSDDQE